MKNQSKRVCLVGCGRISARHIEALKAAENIQLASVCDCDSACAKACGTANNVPWYTDIKALKGMDVISILTPSGLHPRHVIEAAEYCDAPLIVCEKPLSLTVRETVEMYRSVKKNNKKLLPVFQNRYNPLIQFIKKMLEQETLGTVYQFNCNVFWNRNDEYFNIDWHGSADLDGGVLFTQASHYVDMLHYLFGEVCEYKGLGGNLRGFPVQDTVSAVLKFKDGVVGALNATVCVYRTNYCTEFTVIGSKGTVRLSGTNLNKIEFWDVEGKEKPALDFTLDHQYGKGHDIMYGYVAAEDWSKFPDYDDVLSGISLMEKLSF